jgi:hypothetical protein
MLHDKRSLKSVEASSNLSTAERFLRSALVDQKTTDATTHLAPEVRVWMKSWAAPTLVIEVDNMIGLTGDHVEHLPLWARRRVGIEGPL